MPTDTDAIPPFVPDDHFIESVRSRVAGHRRRNRRRATSALALVAVLAGSGVWYANDRLSSVQRVDLGTPERDGADPIATGEPFNVLFVGTDSCTSAGLAQCTGRVDLRSMADSIAVLHVDPSQHTIDLLNIPRDLWLPDRETKINALPIAELASTLEDRFRIRIDHAAGITMAGFVRIADRLGIRLDPDTAIQDQATGLNLQPGCQTVDGDQLLALVRARHLIYESADGRWLSDPTGTLGRIERGTAVVRAAFTQLGGASASLSLIDDIATELAESGVVDDGLSNAELVAFGRVIAGSTILSSATLPTLLGGNKGISFQALGNEEAVNDAITAVGGHYDPSTMTPTTASPEPTMAPIAMPPSLGWQGISAC